MLSIETMPPEGSLGLDGPVADDTGRIPIHHLTWHRYAALLHPEDSRSVGVMAYSSRETSRGEEVFRTRQAGAVGAEMAETVRRCRPKFLTMNSFRLPKLDKAGKPVFDYHVHPCKGTWNLAALQALWVDLDFYRKGCAYRHGTPRTMVPLVLARLREEGLPYPSYLMSSGNGLFAVWLHTRLLPGMHPVWQAAQKRLNDAFRDMGRDLKAMPATQHFRVPGTKNAGRTVEVFWPHYVDQVERYDWQMLRDDILPYTPEQVREHRKAK